MQLNEIYGISIKNHEENIKFIKIQGKNLSTHIIKGLNYTDYQFRLLVS